MTMLGFLSKPETLLFISKWPVSYLVNTLTDCRVLTNAVITVGGTRVVAQEGVAQEAQEAQRRSMRNFPLNKIPV